MSLLRMADLAGTLLFAIEGGLAAGQARLDLLGIAVLAFVTALGGGIIRDLLIGATPVAALADPLYAPVALAGAVATMLAHPVLEEAAGHAMLVLDAAGLALFAVAGAAKGLDFRLRPVSAALLGMVTAAGGGAIRDMLLAQIPVVLRADFYAAAALAGAALLVVIRRAGGSPALAATACGLLCFGLRLAAIWRGWSLPHLS